MQKTITVEDILDLFKNRKLAEEEIYYLHYHSRRLAYTTGLVQRFINEHQSKRILDIGPHFLTYCLKRLLKPEPEISTLGFKNERLFPSELTVQHIKLDLNECESAEHKFIYKDFDLIIFSETIEHLYTSPKVILTFFYKLLKKEPGAGILIQTPNAASFPKRIRLLCGYNPFELIRVDRTNPGHLREYTMRELENYATDAGFKICFKEYCSYWWDDNPIMKLVNLWPSMRAGITLLLLKT